MSDVSEHVEEREFYSTREAAQRLGVSLRSVQVWVESGRLPAWKTDGGHRRIPRAAVESIVRQQELARAAGERPATVVLVDDDRYMLDLYRRVLSARMPTLRIETAENGFEGLLMIGKVRPDLVLLDLQMPGLDGFRLLHALGRVPEYADTHVVVLTGLDDEEIAERGGLPRSVIVLHKPYSIPSLPDIVQQALQSAPAAGSSR